MCGLTRNSKPAAWPARSQITRTMSVDSLPPRSDRNTVNPIGALLRTRQEPRGIGLQRVRRGPATFDPPNPERAISRRIEVKVSPAQVYRLADPQPMPVHHRQQQLIALTLPTDAAGGIDHPPRLVRRKILPPRNIRLFSATLTIGRVREVEDLCGCRPWQEFEMSFRSSICLCRRFLIWVKAGLTPIGHCPPNSRGRVHAMRATALQAPPWLVVIDKGSYETLTYFLNRTMAELWRRKHGGQLYERELEPPYWRAAKPEAPGGGGRQTRAVTWPRQG